MLTADGYADDLENGMIVVNDAAKYAEN